MFDHVPGATPLDQEDIDGLIPNLTTRAELDEFEAANILKAAYWAATAPTLSRDFPNVSVLRALHREMLDLTWKWAGRFRRRDTNIGIPWEEIPAHLQALCDDTRYWISHNTYPWPELGARFHHRLVAIHPFPNGNGRHARLATDVLLRQNGQPPFTWGSASLVATGPMRQSYIAALQAADREDYGPLTSFVTT